MEMADFWLLDKTVVHKLFKVLCPRFEDSTLAYTKMYRAPREYPCVDFNQRMRARSILELRGNPYPPVAPDQAMKNRNLIHNILLHEAKKAFYHEKKKETDPKITGEGIAKQFEDSEKQWKHCSLAFE